MQYTVHSSSINGSLSVPASKSHSLRAILMASLADGISRIRASLPSPDTLAMIQACRALGAEILEKGPNLEVRGLGGRPKIPDQVIDVGNSGQVLRFVAALAALLPQYTIFTGDASIRSIRPVQPLLDALSGLGAFAVSSKGDGHAPIIVRGPAKAGNTRLDGADSQPVSAMLFLASFLEGKTTILVDNPGEQPWIDLTLHWLERLGIPCRHDNYREYTVRGPAGYSGFDYTVPGDWSSATFPLVAALIQNQPLELQNLDFHDPQGDKAILDVLRAMGANFIAHEEEKRLEVRSHNGLRGLEADLNHIIDAVPALAALACFAQSPSLFRGVEIARHKECDRLRAIACELGKMGGLVEELPDGLRITPARLHGALTESWRDHRIAMSIAVAALSCGETVIRDSACVAKSFPSFVRAMSALGARIEESGSS
ncbi:MAG: 3-phosphoshikimate 1-carboxyvinyltransferase [Desulfovibrionaceae bacterium]|nr:3-phosphoshikimate 1-carboxyvinyltransferase [Desulfovibrionaceae bacterium]